jgi:hypothetical protein
LFGSKGSMIDLKVGQFVTALAHSGSSKELESAFTAEWNPFYEFTTVVSHGVV